MPFRSKLKAAFGRSGSTADPAASTGGTTSSVTDAINKREKAAKKNKWNKKDPKWEDWPEDVYKPHEIPPPKYRRPAAKEHTKKLEKFTWATDAQGDDRRASAASQYSPMGSRLHSRRSSAAAPDEDAGPLSSPAGQVVEGVDPAAAAAASDEAGAPLDRTATLRPAADGEQVDGNDLAPALTALTVVPDAKKPDAPAPTATVGA